MSKFALIIANTEYTDPGLSQLLAPGQDAEDFARVLHSSDTGAFDDVKVLLNQTESIVREAIDGFFAQKKADDLLVLYFSGHGVRDEQGALFLALKNTNRDRLRSTAIKSDFIRESMDQSHSRRQVLILDCCNSGAFAQGIKAGLGASMGTGAAFEGNGYGKVVLTATDSTQFAWEGDKVIAESGTKNSLFTHYLVHGLQGEADTDADGKISIDDLYEYAYGEIVSRTPKQTPVKFAYKQQGKIYLRQNRPEDFLPVVLPVDLLQALQNLDPAVREPAVGQLAELLKGKNIALARSARSELERIAVQDDSQRVVQTAAMALKIVRKAEAERDEAVEREADEEQGDRAGNKSAALAGWDNVLWMVLGWQIVYALFTVLPLQGLGNIGYTIRVVLSEALSGVVIVLVLHRAQVLSGRKGMLWITLAWIFSSLIGVAFMNGTSSSGIISSLFLNLLLGGIRGLVIVLVLRSEKMLSSRKNMLWITLGWMISYILYVILYNGLTEIFLIFGWYATIQSYFHIPSETTALFYIYTILRDISLLFSVAASALILISRLRKEQRSKS